MKFSDLKIGQTFRFIDESDPTGIKTGHKRCMPKWIYDRLPNKRHGSVIELSHKLFKDLEIEEI